MAKTGTPDTPTIVRDACPEGLVRGNRLFQEQIQFSDRELSRHTLLAWIHPEDRAMLARALKTGSGKVRARHRTRRGDWVLLSWEVRSGASGPVVFGSAVQAARPAPPRPAPRKLQTIQELLAAMALIIEDERPGMKCSVLLLDASGQRISVGAGPSFPDSYNDAIEGLQIGPGVGSCGTAAFWNRRVIVEDILTDPLWEDLREHAAAVGVRSCWSHPIASMSGEVLGATALYSPAPRIPTQAELDGLERAARMFGLAIDRWRAQAALQDSERRQRQRELEIEDQLHQAAKMEALGVLAGGLAHDFNNLLGSVLGNAELATSLVPVNGTVHEMLQDIITASSRATELCSQMLAYAGRGMISPQHLECNAVVQECGAILQTTLPRTATLNLSLSDDALHIEADRGQLGQVIMNLITNAAESLEGNPGTITAATARRTFSAADLARLQPGTSLPAGEYACLTISDTGCGMTDEIKARVFDPFFTTRFTGRGLGLAAVQGIVRRHHGVVHLESSLGEGSTFTVLFPYVRPSIMPAVVEPTAPTRSTKRVLVVDDEPMLGRTLGRILRVAGFDTLHAASGREAIEVYRQEHASIDCVLLDFSMPDLDGEETFRELRKIREGVQVVLNSGYAERDLMDRFKDAGFARVLKKPTPRKTLVEAIRAVTG